ncbi:MarR family winged helix-turn-helix transcriptional regulator [Promicromonospora sp. Marseille-Q5078]
MDENAPDVRDAGLDADDETELAATVLHASRGLLGVIARSVAEALDEVSLPQLRALVLLCSAGPMRQGAVAERLGVHSSTFSRNADRLVAGGWVRRAEDPARRHGVLLVATQEGRALVERVSVRRRDAIAEVLRRVPSTRRSAMVAALAEFTSASGEPDPRDLQTLAL